MANSSELKATCLNGHQGHLVMKRFKEDENSALSVVSCQLSVVRCELRTDATDDGLRTGEIAASRPQPYRSADCDGHPHFGGVGRGERVPGRQLLHAKGRDLRPRIGGCPIGKELP